MLAKLRCNARALIFTVPVFGLVIGFIFFSENLSAAKYSGIGMILIGIVLVSRSYLHLEKAADKDIHQSSVPDV